MGDAFLRFDFVFGVAVGEGVGEVFLCLGEAVGDGLGVVFLVDPFRCLRGAGVGLVKIFFIFVFNESWAALAAYGAPNSIATISKPQNIFGGTTRLEGRLTRSPPLARSRDLPVHVARLPPGPFCEMPSEPAPDINALQFMPRRVIFRAALWIAENNQRASS